MPEITPADFGIEDGRAKATDLLHRLVLVKEQLRELAAERELLEQAIRLELANDPTPLIDHERGIVAVLKERNKPASIDLGTLAKDDPRAGEYLADAARAGVLTASLTPLRALRGKSAWADALLGREMPNGVTYVLEVEETR